MRGSVAGLHRRRRLIIQFCFAYTHCKLRTCQTTLILPWSIWLTMGDTWQKQGVSTSIAWRKTGTMTPVVPELCLKRKYFRLYLAGRNQIKFSVLLLHKQHQTFTSGSCIQLVIWLLLKGTFTTFIFPMGCFFQKLLPSQEWKSILQVTCFSSDFLTL